MTYKKKFSKSNHPEKRTKKRLNPQILGILLVCLLFLGLGYYLLSVSKLDNTKNWKTANTGARFYLTFKYPEDWTHVRDHERDKLILPYINNNSSGNNTVTDSNGCTLSISSGGAVWSTDEIANEVNVDEILSDETIIDNKKFTKQSWISNNQPIFISYKPEKQILNFENLWVWIPQFNATSCLNNIEKILSTFVFQGQTSENMEINYYSGEVSPRVPYKNLKFIEIDARQFPSLNAALDKADYHWGDYVIDGYTFTAEKDEYFEFLAQEDWNRKPRSFIETELYSYGPTVIERGTYMGFTAPVSGRYFYVIKGFDVGKDIPEEAKPENKYGSYILSITYPNNY
ncbi:hypothetical protein HYT02_06055 [Candidatus Gottesmanbacteria bacterium]|nr:hypothetical protein [Candidatus Gottesmanbacteria bacterium]